MAPSPARGARVDFTRRWPGASRQCWPYRTSFFIFLAGAVVFFVVGQPGERTTLLANVGFELTLGSVSLPEGQPDEHEPPSAARSNPQGLSSWYGFYIHAHGRPAAVIRLVREVKKFFAGSPIYLMSEGYMDFAPLCAAEGCKFVMCPPANDRWHPWPFLRRLHDAATYLQSEFVILLEPDNTLHGSIRQKPDFDAGGLLVKDRKLGGSEYVERLARVRVSDFHWTPSGQEVALRGGSCFRRAVVLDAFADENVAKIDWNMLAENFSKEIFSYDSAMQYALAARGWAVMPWTEVKMHKDGNQDAAFLLGNPTYEVQLKPEDAKLYSESEEYQGKDLTCQVCYSFERYVERWGTDRCTNRKAFEFSDRLIGRYHPHLMQGEPCETDLASLCEPGKKALRFASTTGGSGFASLASTTRVGVVEKYGFYLHVFHSPAAVLYQVRKLKEVFPTSPVYIMSDGGLDFGPLCNQTGCTATVCPPANDRWHPWPFFRRLYDAAEALNTEFVIMLEPDNTIHGPIKEPPKYDAGGVLVRDRSFAGADYVEKLAKKRVDGYKWRKKNQQAGLCGGSYYRREAILDALSDERVAEIDWNYLGEKFSKEIYSSDFALQYALAARGWTIMPWEEAAQMHNDKDIPLAGPKDAAFRHYSGPVGKPTYELKMRKEDQHLVKEQPVQYRGRDPNCQLCYNLDRYVALYGSSRCTSKLPFKYSKLLMERYHPELKTRKCDLMWLCEPGKIAQFG